MSSDSYGFFITWQINYCVEKRNIFLMRLELDGTEEKMIFFFDLCLTFLHLSFLFEASAFLGGSDTPFVKKVGFFAF